MMRVSVESAVGESLAHDVIKYGPGTKKVLFKKGHLVKEEDVEPLKDAGNYYVYVSDENEIGIHEDQAAVRMAHAAVGSNLTVLKPQKGRVRVLADKPGLFKSKTSVIEKVNEKDDFVFAVLHDKKGVMEREEVASVKLLPLVTEEEKLREVKEILEEAGPVLEVVSPELDAIGLIVTGTEIYEGRVEEAFESRIGEKLETYGLEIEESIILPDDKEKIKDEILDFEKRGFELILVTGGMAVDSDDVTPDAIRETGAEVISRGTPVFPGNMLMTARLKGSYILGVPACVLPDEKTSFDKVLPMILAGENITKEKISKLGEGGLL